MQDHISKLPIAWQRHLYLLLVLNTCNHMQNSGARFVVVLLAIHQQASPLVIGLLIGLNSLIPALSSMSLGRMLDRMHSMRTALLVSSIITSAGVLLPFFWESIVALFIFTVVTGSAFNVFRIASQQMTGRYGGAQDRPRNYNLYAQGLAAGNLLSPLIAGFAIDHLGFRYAFLVMGMLALPSIAAFLLRRLYLASAEKTATPDKAAEAKSGILNLLKLQQLRRVLIAGAALMAVWDMFTFVWPQYGAELKFSASQIGVVASIFFSGTFVVRALATRLLRHFSQWQLLLTAMLCSSFLFVAFPFTSSMLALGLLAFVLGLVLGIIQPITMTLVYDEAPAERKGEVIGLRLTLAFSMHIAMPLAAGALASSLGLGIVWYMAAAILLAGGWANRAQWHYRKI